MSTGPRRIKFLSGSPSVQTLNWDERNLMSTFCPQIRRYLGEDIEVLDESQTTASFSFPAWRLVNFKGDPQQTTGLEPPQQLRPVAANDGLDTSIDRSDFLDHSYAVIQDLQSSQIQVPDDTSAETATFLTSFTDTFSTTTTSFATSEDSTLLPDTGPPPPPLSFSGAITDLNSIPSASHIRRIQPQTVTVNLIAGIISLSAPRTVSLRRRPDIEMEIVELLVGDDTRAGFNISFWLSPAAAAAATTIGAAAATVASKAFHESAAEREALGSLRAGDVVLLTNVALSEFKGCVYGQSLNRRTTRNRTSVIALAGSRRIEGLIAGKAGRVREWADRFVGTGRGLKRTVPDVGKLANGDGKRQCVREVEELPPDTQ